MNHCVGVGTSKLPSVKRTESPAALGDEIGQVLQ